jgi:hypothetical protein
MARTDQRSGRRAWMVLVVTLGLMAIGSAEAAKNHLIVGFEDTVGTMNYYP